MLITLGVFTVVTGAGLSLLASDSPDGLEWSYSKRPDQPDFKAAVANNDSTIVAVDDFQSKYSPLPDYSLRSSAAGRPGEVSAGWTSFAGVLGSAITMVVIWMTAWILRKKQSLKV